MKWNSADLPNGWITATLGELLPLNYGKALSGRHRNNNGNYAVYGSSGVVGKHSDFVANGPCILVGRKGSAGKVFYSNENCWPIDTAFYSDSSENVNLRFFYYLLTFIRLEQNDNSTAIPSLSRNIYNQIVVPFAPLEEQHRIVDRVEQLFSEIDGGEALLKQVQNQLAIYRRSVLKSAVSGRILKSRAKWVTYHVGQLLTDIRYGTAKKCAFNQSKTPVLRIPNVAAGKIDISDLKHTDFTAAELRKLRLEKGDILLVRSNGSVSLVGLSAVITDQAVGFAYAGYLIRLRLKRDIVLPEFLNLCLHSPQVRSEIELHAKSTSGVHNINSDEVKNIAVSLPSITEQEEIVDRVSDIFSQIDALESWCATELQRSQTLRQSILKSAFSGQLVPQDASDEPAIALLKRIQNERASAPKVARARQKKAAVKSGRKAAKTRKSEAA